MTNLLQVVDFFDMDRSIFYMKKYGHPIIIG